VSITRKFVLFAVGFCSCAFSQSGDLSHGKIEIRGFGGGVNAGNLLVSQPAFSVGAEGAIGLNRIVAVTGDYSFDHLGSFNGFFNRRVHEYMGGFRFSIPNRSRITPYAGVSAGGAAVVDKFSSSSGFNSGSDSLKKFAIALGAGANYRITRRTGVNVDVRGVAVSFGFNSTPGWIIRTTGGFYFRF